MDRIFCNVGEAANLLNIKRSKLYGLLKEGAIESAKIGNRRVVRLASISSFADKLGRAA